MTPNTLAHVICDTTLVVDKRQCLHASSQRNHDICHYRLSTLEEPVGTLECAAASCSLGCATTQLRRHQLEPELCACYTRRPGACVMG